MAKENSVFLGQRISKTLSDLIDTTRAEKSRSQWTREAMVEKLIRESPDQAKLLLPLMNPPDRKGVGGRPSHKKKVVILDPFRAGEEREKKGDNSNIIKRGELIDGAEDLQEG